MMSHAYTCLCVRVCVGARLLERETPSHNSYPRVPAVQRVWLHARDTQKVLLTCLFKCKILYYDNYTSLVRSLRYSVLQNAYRGTSWPLA